MAPIGIRQSTLAPLGVALLCALEFAAIGWTTLASAHPHEDAFIIFRYANHIADGLGIVFNPGGPVSEGATDFLWLMAMSLLVRLGLDAAFAALALNSVGAGLIGFLFARAASKEPLSPLVRLPMLAFALFCPFYHGAMASYYGYSSLLYSALILLLLDVALRERKKELPWLPVLGLIVAMMRTDGVVIGVGFTVLGLLPARRLGGSSRYLLCALASGAVGVGYFLWRWWYFGLLLPLPLYVKGSPIVISQASGLLREIYTVLPGLEGNMFWILDPSATPVWLVAVAAILGWRTRDSRKRELRRMLYYLIPFLMFLVVLLIPQQMQNFSDRFQAPIWLVACFLTYQIALFALSQSHQQRRWRLSLAIVLLLFARPGVAYNAMSLFGEDRAQKSNYLDGFAPRLGRHVDRNTRLALTEAGAIPYWTDAEVFDIVGLTNPDRAKFRVTQSYLRRIDPDIVQLHFRDYLLDYEQFLIPEDSYHCVYRVTPERLAAAVRENIAYLYEHTASETPAPLAGPIQFAALALTRFLIESRSYEIYAVNFGGWGPEAGEPAWLMYSHLWGFRKELPHRAEILRDLQRSCDDRRQPSYLETLESPRVGSSDFAD